GERDDLVAYLRALQGSADEYPEPPGSDETGAGSDETTGSDGEDTAAGSTGGTTGAETPTETEGGAGAGGAGGCSCHASHRSRSSVPWWMGLWAAFVATRRRGRR
nr:hypothetical protein [Deltaproteobacteria bacterium]